MLMRMIDVMNGDVLCGCGVIGRVEQSSRTGWDLRSSEFLLYSQKMAVSRVANIEKLQYITTTRPPQESFADYPYPEREIY